jgi:adenylate cyclase
MNADGSASGVAEWTAGSNPIVRWILTEGSTLVDTRELVRRLCETMVANGLPVFRVRVTLRILHPQFLGTSYTWRRDTDEVEEFKAPHDIVTTDQYLKSPYAALFQGAGGVRRRLDGPDATLDFPILDDLRAEGGTDYVAMPILFSDGKINAITLATDRPGGFSAAELATADDMATVLGLVLEVHAAHRITRNILDTYLGSHTGERVLNGLIRRGDGEQIHAVIWFSDMRGSTTLADRLPSDDFLALLNEYFEHSAAAVLDQGGEVLRFIGDAMLAIFPVNAAGNPRGRCPAHERACNAALAAARDACRRLDAVNSERVERGAPIIRYGIGVHVGDLLYGNVGAPERLEFTVIGAAANEAARIEAMCKVLGRSVLISDACARHIDEPLTSVGVHALRGVGEPVELFTIG